MKWKPIKSAPKRRLVVLFIPDEGVTVGQWFSMSKTNWWETYDGNIGDPTHWMDLPDAPPHD